MKSYEKMRNDLIASNALYEAKAVSQYLRNNTNLSIADRNQIAENYFKKTLTNRFSNIYTEATQVPGAIVTFVQTIGGWVVELFKGLGSVFEILASGISKLSQVFLGVSKEGWFQRTSGELHKVIGNVAGMDITLAQAIGIAAILGICLWAAYKLGKWLYRKFKRSESYVPMFTENDNKFLLLMKRPYELNEGILDLAKGSITKFATYCINKGREVLPKVQEIVSRSNNPKLQKFVSEIGPSFSKMMKSPAMKTLKSSAIESAEFLNKKMSEFIPQATQFAKNAYKGFQRGMAVRRR